MSIKSFIGPVIHCSDKGELIIHEHARLDVKDGKIHNIMVDPVPNNLKPEDVRYLKNGEFLIPGFIDGHIHAVQIPNLGLGYDKPLLDWLDSYTFPLEAQYADKNFAEKIFDAVVKRTLTMGTTTACYFASLHATAALILAKKVDQYGQRALVGKVNMNKSNRENYEESTEDSILTTKKFIEDVKRINNHLVQPVLTPRFALSCDMKLMKVLGDLAKEKNLHVQTHISENKCEIQAVEAIFPECSSYAEVYNEAGLLTEKTVLAHGVHLSDSEIEIINKRKTAIIHCPASNTCLKSGLCDVQRLREANVKVGLGTDISGGNFPSILDTMRAALQVSTHLAILKENSNPEYKPLNYREAFYLATLGGAEALSMSDKIGNFEKGKEFDALIINLNAPGSALDNLKDYTLDERLQRLIYSGDDRNIVEVYVCGKPVIKKTN